ncbi:MAG: M48 family metalloprotease [Elainellaceae cyanobacterium]
MTLSLSFFKPGRVTAQIPQNPCATTIAQADQLYLEGDRTAAEELYRQCKSSPEEQDLETFFPEPITDPDQLPPGGQVLWREAQAGYEQGLESRLFVPLELLLQDYSEFVPAYRLMAQALEEYERDDEILDVLEQAATLFPNSADIAWARVTALQNADKPLEASIAARLFAIVNPDHPDVQEFEEIAEDEFKSFRRQTRREFGITGGLGVIGRVLLGGGSTVSNALETIPMIRMLTSGEEGMGSRLAEAEIENRILIEDPVIVDYVSRIGNDMATLMGRNEFEYEFYVIQDNSLNAFALPGGKVFVNSGSILATNSEAELAGLLGHEVAHAVLSHGYQQMARSNLLSTIGEVTSLSNITNLMTLNFSRNQERQCDILGTRALAGYGYAADGLYNFFVTLNEQSSGGQPEYLSTHPATETRLQYLQALIQRNGYNRFAYEGVEEHNRIRQRLQELL